jgi:ribosomal protein L3
MAGHHGNTVTSTIKIEVIQVDPAQSLLYVAGPVPGPRGGLVTVSETYMSKKFRTEAKVAAVKKDKMGNIIKPGAAKGKK